MQSKERAEKPFLCFALTYQKTVQCLPLMREVLSAGEAEGEKKLKITLNTA